MSPSRCLVVSSLLACATLASNAFAAGLSPAMQEKVQTKIVEVQEWAADPVIVAAVAAQNAQPLTPPTRMSDERWRVSSLLDPFVRSFSNNPAGIVLRDRRSDWVAEAFLSDASGVKVAFLAKPTRWCHAGLPKHDVPMSGKIWQGSPNVDESTGLLQLQVAVPVLQDGKPIGSLVVGIIPGKL